MTEYMSYGGRVQDALREEIRDALAQRGSKVKNMAGLSRALGFGESRQYIASRFSPDPKSGRIRDLTVPDLIAIGKVIDIPATELLRRAVQAASLTESASGEDFGEDFGEGRKPGSA